MTIYIVENFYGEPFQAYKTSDGARLGLLEQYTKNCLPNIIRQIKDGVDIVENTNCIQTDLESIFAHGFVEDFAYIHECELKE